jgi:hypothetical protein
MDILEVDGLADSCLGDRASEVEGVSEPQLECQLDLALRRVESQGVSGEGVCGARFNASW